MPGCVRGEMSEIAVADVHYPENLHVQISCLRCSSENAHLHMYSDSSLHLAEGPPPQEARRDIAIDRKLLTFFGFVVTNR